MVTNNALCTDTAEKTSGYRSDREDLSEDSFIASVDGNSNTTDKRLQLRTRSIKVCVILMVHLK